MAAETHLDVRGRSIRVFDQGSANAKGAIPAVFFNNAKIQAVSAFTYDPLYRLIAGEGREHAGQAIAFDAGVATCQEDTGGGAADNDRGRTRRERPR